MTAAEGGRRSGRWFQKVARRQPTLLAYLRDQPDLVEQGVLHLKGKIFVDSTGFLPVVLWRLRLSRSLRDVLTIMERLAKAGAGLKCLAKSATERT